MINITIPLIVEQIEGYLNQNYDYDALRSFVYSRYEGEEEFYIQDEADEVLSVLSPYVETDEAIPDNQRDRRLQRLAKLLVNRRDMPPAAVALFALEYDEIAELTRKRDEGLITEAVYREQLQRLTPAKFDVDLIIDWAEKQKRVKEPDIGH